MNASAFRPSTIEALKALWVALPVRASNDGETGDPRERQMQILDTYCFALSEFSSEAIMNTVNNLRAGKIEEASKSFCPKAPELAVYVRSEQKRLELLNSPRALPAPTVSKPFKHWGHIQREETIALASLGYRCVAENIGIDEMVTRARRKQFPEKTVWFWCIQEAWSPPTHSKTEHQAGEE